ncbi:hypothetical protein HYH02_005721 [Chlamydomonas schloesseri]|uniref:Uncharacterized protein n=1 Tax=Chlamydomonas schloesseri TaxID=2026947 RepID=A0A835WKA7_9CHLO|nr:hypothetical protein HYH02_005721 [Chlamydomonas schloesseri]|eukprot:KAG2448967.1 hypothetical protein HYH02_005721 [Chlamydomonas schloesseri]
MAQLRLSSSRVFAKAFNGGVTCMDLDKVEDRFLLSGGADTTLALFDTHTGSSDQTVATMKPLFSLRRQNSPHAHKFMVSAVAWYPVDTGLFVTGSHDCFAKVWDTNAGEVVTAFQLPKKVTSVAMSHVSTSHCLIACGCEDTNLRLCDPTSGAITHVFHGHRDAIWVTAWATHAEYEVLSGDGAGQVRVWDVRRAGCRAVLDQYATKRPARGAPGGSAELDAPPPYVPMSKKQRRGLVGSAGSLAGSASAPALLATDELPPGSPGAVAAAGRMKESALRAHSGGITALLPCPDGLSLLTAGTDGRMRLWDAASRVNKLVGYEGTHNRALRARTIAVTEDARVVFYPTGSSINVYEVESGRLLSGLQGGHTESINCVQYNPATGELYSGANDQKIAVWSFAGLDTPVDEFGEEDGAVGEGGGGRQQEDRGGGGVRGYY